MFSTLNEANEPLSQFLLSKIVHPPLITTQENLTGIIADNSLRTERH